MHHILLSYKLYKRYR